MPMTTPRRLAIFAALPALALAACSDESHYAEEEAMVDVAEYDGSTTAGDAAEGAADAVAERSASTQSSLKTLPKLDALPASLPKLAYTYDFKWRMPGEDISKLQRTHANLCEQQGPATCQILGMRTSGEEPDEITGELQMAVASAHARAFGALLEDEAEDAGAKQLSANIETDELSKKMVDTEASLRARTELRDRLMDVLKTRKGSVEELVEAERSVAQVNQEIDQARSWLKEMEGRVAYSRVNVRYEAGGAVTNDFMQPVSSAVGSLGSILGWLLAIMIVLGAIIAPIAGIVLGGRAINRRLNEAPSTGEG